LIRTTDEASPEDIASVTDQLITNPPEVFIAQTGQGVSWWMEQLSSSVKEEFITSLSTSVIWSRGAKSTSRCRSFGLEVSWQAVSETAREIADRCRSVAPGTRIAVQLVGTTRDLIVEALEQAGAEVVEMCVYRYQIPDDTQPAQRLLDATLAGEIDAITFTASPAIAHLREIARTCSLLTPLDHAMRTTCRPVVVGPVCATTAHDAGWCGVVEPDVARLIPMLDALTNALMAPQPLR